MDKILFYGPSLDADTLERAVTGLEVLACPSKKDLSSSLIREQDVVAVIANLGSVTAEDKEFITSLSSHFHIVKLALLLDAHGEIVAGPNSKQFNPPFSGEDFADNLHSFIFTDAIRNRRQHNRIEWILHAHLQEDDSTKKYEIHSLSGGGAFLKSEGHIPSARQTCAIRIDFKDVKFTTDCEILEQRIASSNLPFGFPIRFNNLSKESEQIIDGIVNDVLFQELINPQQEAEVPTLGEDLLSPDFSAL